MTKDSTYVLPVLISQADKISFSSVCKALAESSLLLCDNFGTNRFRGTRADDVDLWISDGSQVKLYTVDDEQWDGYIGKPGIIYCGPNQVFLQTGKPLPYQQLKDSELKEIKDGFKFTDSHDLEEGFNFPVLSICIRTDLLDGLEELFNTITQVCMMAFGSLQKGEYSAWKDNCFRTEIFFQHDDIIDSMNTRITVNSDYQGYIAAGHMITDS